MKYQEGSKWGIWGIMDIKSTTVILLGIGLVGLVGASARRKWKKKAVDKS